MRKKFILIWGILLLFVISTIPSSSIENSALPKMDQPDKSEKYLHDDSQDENRIIDLMDLSPRTITLIHNFPVLIHPIQQIIPFLKSDKPSTDDTQHWGLLIAVGEYLNNPSEDRPSMLTEVENLYDALISSENWISSHIKKIKADQANLENILRGFSWLMQKEDSNDISLIYITTHGYYLNEDLPPYDEADGKDEILVPYEGFDDKSKFLWDDEINLFCSLLQSKGVCLIIDSCFSGGFNDAYQKTTSYSQQWNDDFVGSLRSGAHRVILMSSEEDQVSYGSTFSRFIAQGLHGPADNDDNDEISAEEVFDYAEPFVTMYGRQQPTMVDAFSGQLPLVEL
jgi:hypothetical protein